MDFVTVVEVGPRDGLQNEKLPIATEQKLQLIALLADCGFARIEVTAFVSPRWVPQMADHDLVMRSAARRVGLRLSALVPNERGAIAAIEAGAAELAVFTSASETFSQRNVNCSIDESIERFRPVMDRARDAGLPVRGYVSCAIDCPFEGPVAPDAVAAVVARLRAIGCAEIALSDTIGRATPDRVERMTRFALEEVPAAMLAGHFHDTFGHALDNVDAALDLGLRVFDSSIGGLGGCPYAPGAAGNLGTTALVEHLAARRFRTGIDAAKLRAAEEFVATVRA